MLISIFKTSIFQLLKFISVNFFQCCAVSFVEGINAESLNISSTDFDRYMSGEAVPPGSGNEHLCRGLQLMHENLRELGELRQRQEKVMAEALQLLADMNEFKENFVTQIEQTKQKTPLTIRPRKVKVDPDAEFSGTNSNLPSPLTPLRVHLDGTIVQPGEKQVDDLSKDAQEMDTVEDGISVNSVLSTHNSSAIDNNCDIDMLLGDESVSTNDSTLVVE